MKRPALRSGESAQTPLRQVKQNPMLWPALKGLSGEHLAVMLSSLMREAIRTQNPVYAWQAYLYARKNHQPIPDWILTYFDAAAERLMRLANGRPPRDWRTAILKALGFPRAPLRSLRRDWADYFLALESRYEDGLGRKGVEVVKDRERVSRARVYRARTRA